MTQEQESYFANPDLVNDEKAIWPKRLSELDVEKLEILKEGFALLTPRQRKVIMLLSQGLTYGDIAMKLWVSKGSVQQHYRRAKIKLLKYYEEKTK